MNESSVSKGFGATCGVILAVVLALGVLVVLPFVVCGGGLAGFIGTDAFQQAQEAADRSREQNAAAERANQAAELEAELEEPAIDAEVEETVDLEGDPAGESVGSDE